MKAPLAWLREYVPVGLSPQELASLLALTGTEVERVSRVGVPEEGENLTRFVVGKVTGCSRHPNADKLSVCLVDVGEGSARTIVCGAANVRAGLTVGVVLPGGVMPDGTAIREAKLRGILSSGMIMSAAELGFEAQSEGIMELPGSWSAGEPLSSRLPISEWILEVEVTPNRPDCLSIRGLAREIATVTEAPFEENWSVVHPWGEIPVHEDVAVEVWDPDLCPRYAARAIRGIKVAESPEWLKARVTHAGMRPINNAVDITNYVMWATGQPLHAFDLATLAGRKVIARRARPGERITTLDGVDRLLTTDMLVIADAERASVIAGIMGGLDSEVTPATTDVLLEAANFSGPSILRTSSALGLRSESSTRFEKGLDQNLVTQGLDLACKLLVEICGGRVSVGTIDVRDHDVRPWDIRLRPVRVKEVVGAPIPGEEMTRILRRLGCEVRETGADLTVTVPTFRADLEREIDLVEEIVRIYGLDKIPSALPHRRIGRGGLDARQTLQRRLEDSLWGCGLNQAITYSFVDTGWADRLRLRGDDERRQVVRLTNPLSSEQSVMRTMLLPGLLDTARRNLAVREDRVPLFEMGRTFHPGADALPIETLRVGLLIMSGLGDEGWLHADAPMDFFLIKGVVERLLDAAGLSAGYRSASEPFLHPGRSATVWSMDEYLGWAGELHPLVSQAFDLRGLPVVAAELDATRLLELAPGARQFVDLLAFPSVEQDLALLVDQAVPAARLLEEARTGAGALLREVRVFDVYEGTQLPAGKKSIALRLTFLSPDRTLQESEITRARDAIVAHLRSSLGAELRS